MKRYEINKPVIIAVSPEPSIPRVTSSAVERPENPDGPFQPRSHISTRKIGSFDEKK